MNEFNKAVKFTLLREGFISNDPKDRGKYTIFGISSRWWPEEVKQLKKLIDERKVAEAKERAINFFYREYWIKANCHTMDLPFAMVVFDTAVNSGRSKAKEILNECKDDWKLYLLLRIVFNTHCKSEKTHLRGWTHRIAKLYEYLEELPKAKV